MIMPRGTHRSKHAYLNPSQQHDHARCQICGSVIPAEFTACYDCDLELGLGEWHGRPRRRRYDVGLRCGLHRMPLKR